MAQLDVLDLLRPDGRKAGDRAGAGRAAEHRAAMLAMSGKAVEAAGDVHTLLLDKTGTITVGDRQATEFLPLVGCTAIGKRRASCEAAGSYEIYISCPPA